LFKASFVFPGAGVVTEHATFRIASSSRSIYQSATVAWLLFLHLSKDHFIFNVLTKSEEISPKVETFILQISRELGFSIYYNCFNLRHLSQIDSYLLEMLGGLHNYDFSFRMVDLIKACFWLVGDINTGRYAVVHDATDVGEGPLGGVKTHDGYRRALIHVEGAH
jgi:hypothetical protein